MSQPGPQVRERHVRQIVDPAITNKGDQVAQVPQVGPLGVLGLTPHDTEMPGEGLDMNQRVCVHDLTLTRQSTIGKHIGVGARRVPAKGRRMTYVSAAGQPAGVDSGPSRRRSLSPTVTMAFGQG